MFKKLFNNLTRSNNEEEKAGTHSPQEEAGDAYEETVYDPETLHGTHYDVADFDAEVERRVQHELDRRNITEISQNERNNWHFNVRREVYAEWTGADSNQTVRWEHANSMKHSGVQTSGFIKVEETNPLLEPVHGFTLKDYAAVVIKMAAGIKENVIFEALGIDAVIWGEINTIWPQRMAEDTSFTVATLYGQYFAENATNSRLETIQRDIPSEGKATMEKMQSDPYFYHELNAARQAAYEYGLDGAQWILDNYGINLSDFQSISMQYMTERNKDWNADQIFHYMQYEQEKQKAYAAKFAAEQGGNVADDVEF